MSSSPGGAPAPSSYGTVWSTLFEEILPSIMSWLPRSDSEAANHNTLQCVYFVKRKIYCLSCILNGIRLFQVQQKTVLYSVQFMNYFNDCLVEPSRWSSVLRRSPLFLIVQNENKQKLKLTMNYLEWEENQLKCKHLVRHQRAHLPVKNVKLGAEQLALVKQQGAII